MLTENIMETGRKQHYMESVFCDAKLTEKKILWEHCIITVCHSDPVHMISENIYGVTAYCRPILGPNSITFFFLYSLCYHSFRALQNKTNINWSSY